MNRYPLFLIIFMITVPLLGGEFSSIVDLWEGKAQLKFQRELKIDPNTSSMPGAGWGLVDQGIWYWFYRDIPEAPKPSRCAADYNRTVMVKSEDQGRTWSNKVIVADPDLSPKGSGCTVLDGSTFQDPKTGDWHLLAQCLSTSDSPTGQVWNLCHYSRKAKDGVFGKFTDDPKNPVIRSGAVFSEICKMADSHCPIGIADEGTPNIFKKEGDYFWVSFHGAIIKNNQVLGYRGVAKTKDFHTWIPVGSVYGPDDFQKAIPGTIGTGASSDLHGEDGNLYSLVETPTLSLMCLVGQDWPLVLVRAPQKNFGPGKWQFPTQQAVPLLQSEMIGTPCALSYARWMLDPIHGLFLIYWDAVKGHRLVKVE